jgi:sulfur carrier protein ThiS
MGQIRANVKLYGILRGYVANYDHLKGIDVTLNEGNTIQDLLRTLNLPEDMAKFFFVSGASKRLTDIVNDGDEINIFVPVSGG